MKIVLDDAKGRMEKTIDALEANLATVRTGRANPAILGRVMVEYYGSTTPLPQLANISTPDPRTLLITPFDKSASASIEKAILEADLGFNPNNQGDSIFVAVPALNDERRRDLVKASHNMAEEAKVGVRNIRRDALTDLKSMEKEGEMSEDELRRSEADVQKLTDEFVARIDQRVKSKEQDILAV
jgi:ribosome recycling factor